MRNTPKNSSQAFLRMSLFLIGLVGALIFAGSWGMMRYSQSLLTERHTLALTRMAQGLSVAVIEDMVLRDFGALESNLVRAFSNESVRTLAVTDNAGQVISKVRRDEKSNQVQALFIDKFMAPPTEGSFQIREMGASTHSWQMLQSGKPLGWLYMEVQDDTAQVMTQLGWRTLYLAIGLAVVLLSVFAYILRKAYVVIDGNESHLKSENSKLSDKANNDPLTGLPNRVALMQKLQESMNRINEVGTGSLAVCFIDLDRFKPVNDEHGHAVGDKVLQAVAGRIRSIARGGDYLARIGGDEFVLIVHGLENTWEVEPVLSRLLHVTTSPILAEGHSAWIGFSIGVAIYPQDSSDPLHLIQHADEAMYKAKRAGGGGWALWQLEDAAQEPRIAAPTATPSA